MWVEEHGRTWRIRGRQGTKVVTVNGGYPTKTAARNALTILAGDKLRGDYIDPRAGKILLDEWLDAWLPSYLASLKPSSEISAEGLIRRYIRPTFGPLPLDDVEPIVVQRWVAALLKGKPPASKPLAVKTVRNAHGLLHKVMAAAVQQRYLRANPCTDTGLPARVHHEMRFLTEPEVGRLLAAMPEHWRPLALLLFVTGLRWGEAVGLKVGRVDVLTGRLRVEETMQELAGSARIVTVAPKTKHSRRTVTFPAGVAAELAPLVVDRDPGDYLFTAVAGGPARIRRFRLPWVEACADSGVGKVRIHDARHSHAAMLISAGVPLTAVQRRLGHSSISVTSDLYGHLMPEVDERIGDTITAAIRVGGWVASGEQRLTAA